MPYNFCIPEVILCLRPAHRVTIHEFEVMIIGEVFRNHLEQSALAGNRATNRTKEVVSKPGVFGTESDRLFAYWTVAFMREEITFEQFQFISG